MKVSILSIFKETNENFKLFVFNKFLLIAAALSFWSSFSQEIIQKNQQIIDVKSAITLVVISIVLSFIPLIITMYQALVISDLKNNLQPANIFARTKNKYLKLILSSIFLALISFLFLMFIFYVIYLSGLYFSGNLKNYIGYGSATIIAVGLIFFLVRTSFFQLLIVLDNEKKPIRQSLKMTKNIFWNLIAVLISLYALLIPYYLFYYLLAIQPEMSIFLRGIILTPLHVLINLYCIMGLINTFLRFKALEEMAPEQTA